VTRFANFRGSPESAHSHPRLTLRADFVAKVVAGFRAE
jgi:hypothetical protein